MPVKRILALGNAEPVDKSINKYIVRLARYRGPSLCFLGTASGDSDGYYAGIETAFSSLGCEVKRLGLFKPPTDDLRDYLMSNDIIYVGGGNTKSMLALWREWGIDAILREAWNAGILLCGPSAGSICWFEQGVTDSIPGKMTPLNCLGFLPGSNCPHYDSEPQRRPAYLELIGNGTLEPGYAADDYAGILFHDTQIAEIVSARPNANVYRVESVNGSATERILERTVTL